jgi:hypothetical protein
LASRLTDLGGYFDRVYMKYELQLEKIKEMKHLILSKYEKLKKERLDDSFHSQENEEDKVDANKEMNNINILPSMKKPDGNLKRQKCKIFYYF